MTTTSFDELSFGACDRRRIESRGPHGGKTSVEIQDNVMPLARRSCETVELERMRLPAALPEFWSLRHRADLSGRPVTTAN